MKDSLKGKAVKVRGNRDFSAGYVYPGAKAQEGILAGHMIKKFGSSTPSKK
jgi:hypothetical protein